MRALVLGAGGQLGRALIDTLPAGWSSEFLTHGQLDIGHSGAVRDVVAASTADVVINAAAFTNVELAEKELELATAVNGRAPGMLAESCRVAGKRMIHVSTDFVFDGDASEPYATDAAAQPINSYGRTKLEGETRVLAALPDACIVRTSWLYGRGRNFVTTVLERMRTQERVPVVMDQVGAPTWTNSLARALWRAASIGLPGVHHWCDSGVASRYDFAVAISEEARLLGLLKRPPIVIPVRTADFPSNVARPSFAVLAKWQTEHALGLHAAHWRANLRAMLGELRSRGPDRCPED